MVLVTVSENEMKLVIKGVHKLWALKSKMNIAINQIKDVRINQVIKKPEGCRLYGCYIPGFIYSGTYYSENGKVFWDVSNIDKSIIIDLNNSDYSQLIIEVDNPEKTVNEIKNKLAIK